MRAEVAPCRSTKAFSVSTLPRRKTPIKIHTPASRSAMGQNRSDNDRPLGRRMPMASASMKPPNKSNSTPAINCPRRMLLLLAAECAIHTASQHPKTKKDQDHCGAIVAKNVGITKEIGKDQEQHTADDHQIEAAFNVMDSFIAQQTLKDDTDADEPEDQGPHVRP